MIRNGNVQPVELVTDIDERSSIGQEVALALDTESTVAAILSDSPPEASAATIRYIETWPVRVRRQHQPSPLFPDGRIGYAPLRRGEDGLFPALPEDASLVLHFAGGEVPERPLAPAITTELLASAFASKQLQPVGSQTGAESTQTVSATLEQLLTLDHARQADLRMQFGAKGANLLLFSEYLDQCRAAMPGMLPLEIPPFTTASVELFENWRQQSPKYNDMLEATRQSAARLVSPDNKPAYYDHVVVVRSGAVASEDGRDLTGAGIYLSAAADVHDPEAFKVAVERVFASVMSEEAITYRAAYGITDEQLGLVIQEYVDTGRPRVYGGYHDVTYGYANSQGTNPHILEVGTSRGTLYYDHEKVKTQLLRIGIRARDALHTIPDHHKAGSTAEDALPAANAAVLAEHYFGAPVQIEFAGNQILQVRPLPAAYRTQESIEFPEGIQPLEWCRATGVGDMVLRLLPYSGTNKGREGVAVYQSEHRFTAYGHDGLTGDSVRGYDTLPQSGAVVLLHNDGYSGHAQMLAMERGLICLFPTAGEVLGRTAALLRKYGAQAVRLRVVSDGYKGGLYVVEPEAYALADDEIAAASIPPTLDTSWE